MANIARPCGNETGEPILYQTITRAQVGCEGLSMTQTKDCWLSGKFSELAKRRSQKISIDSHCKKTIGNHLAYSFKAVYSG